MAKKRVSDDVIIPAAEAVEGDVLVLDGGQRARIVSVGSVLHTITQQVPVQIVSYEFMDGDYAGARMDTALLGNDDVVIAPRPSDEKSSWWHWLRSSRSG